MTLPPQRVPLTDGKLITREWLIALRGLDPVSQTESIAALQESIAVLQSALDELAAMTSSETDVVSLTLMQDGKMRAIARAATRDLEPPNSATAVLMQRMFNPR